VPCFRAGHMCHLTSVFWCTLTGPLHACSGGERCLSLPKVWASSSDGTDRPLRGCCSEVSERAATTEFWCTLTKKTLMWFSAGHHCPSLFRPGIVARVLFGRPLPP
jgi:hypothetical protein